MIAEIPGQDERDAIMSMRMDAMLKASPASFLSIVGGLFAVYVYWSPSAAIPLLVWFACIVAIAFTNLLSTVLYARGLPSGWNARSWARFVCVMHLLSGLSWGVGGAWMLTIADHHQALLTITIGLAAVTVSIPSVVHLPAYHLFHLPIFWCYAIGLFFSSLEFSLLIGTGFFLMGAFGIIIGRILGDQISNALQLSIENKRLALRLEERTAALETANRELEVESQTDPLTGVANRRRLMSVARAIRGPCALMIVDIDHFKSYNDTFGHVDGDACLIAVAEALATRIRPECDLVARLGGEEFAVLLEDVNEREAADVAEAIRAGVEALHRAGTSRVRRPVTVSIGLAVRGADRYKPLATLIAQADEAVYRAKSLGRNRVCTTDSRRKRHVA